MLTKHECYLSNIKHVTLHKSMLHSFMFDKLKVSKNVLKIFPFLDLDVSEWMSKNVCLSACLCGDKKFATSVAEKLWKWISWNFIFSMTLI